MRSPLASLSISAGEVCFRRQQPAQRVQYIIEGVVQVCSQGCEHARSARQYAHSTSVVSACSLLCRHHQLVDVESNSRPPLPRARPLWRSQCARLLPERAVREKGATWASFAQQATNFLGVSRPLSPVLVRTTSDPNLTEESCIPAHYADSTARIVSALAPKSNAHAANATRV